MEDKIIKKFNNKNEESISDDKILHLVSGTIDSSIGEIKKITEEWLMKDTLGAISVRLGFGRDTYKVPTGLYALGNPNSDSPVLVTANYKLTLDYVRRDINGLDVWILIIDTKGVNVWCAAGKGTFSTEEIIYQIKKCKLEKLVNHRELILPQLGAPGVEAYQILKYTGFTAHYGPVSSKDIKAYLKNNKKATTEMRKVNFNTVDRLTVAVLELVHSIKLLSYIFLLILITTIFSEVSFNGYSKFLIALNNTIPYLVAIIIGSIFVPLLLPFIPFKMFSVKALVLAVLWSFVVIRYKEVFMYINDWRVLTAHVLGLTSVIVYLGLNFTGSSTYVSFSGVYKETILTIPVLVVAIFMSLALLVSKIFI